MAQCKDCIHEKVCLHKANIETDTYAYMGIKYDTGKCKHYTSADIVTKSDYEYLKKLLDDKCDRCIEEEKQRVARVAREIFEEIEDVINNIGYFDEIDFKALKKKYTKGEHDEQI